MTTHQIPKVIPRKMMEQLLGQVLVKNAPYYRITSLDRDLTVEYVGPAPMSHGHWLITFKDQSTVMVLDEEQRK